VFFLNFCHDRNVQSYIEEKIGQDEKFSWVHYYLGKCFTGISLRDLHSLCNRELVSIDWHT
jgi:hypothetical protein